MVFFLVWIFCLGRKYGCGWILIMVMLVLQNSVVAGLSGSGKHSGHFYLFVYSLFLSFFWWQMWLGCFCQWWRDGSVGRIFVGFSSGGKKTTVIGISNGLVNSGFVTVVQQIFFFFWFWIDCSGPSNRLVFALIPKMMQ